MIKKSTVDEIEAILLSELGTGSSYILSQKLHEMGLTKETFKKAHIEKLVTDILKEYDKVLGTHVRLIEKELKKKFNVNINH